MQKEVTISITIQEDGNMRVEGNLNPILMINLMSAGITQVCKDLDEQIREVLESGDTVPEEETPVN